MNKFVVTMSCWMSPFEGRALRGGGGLKYISEYWLVEVYVLDASISVQGVFGGDVMSHCVPYLD
jgi:hypothetical protein